MSLAGKIKDDTSLKSIYYDTGEKMGKQFSKGLASAVSAKVGKALSKTPKIQVGIMGGNGSGSEYATGLNRVPYNNYPALLHEDERVLTGAEARSQGTGGGINVPIYGPVTVRKESDIDAVASALFSKIKKAQAVTT